MSYVVVARAPIAEIEAVRRRMGWRFRWVSSFGSDFNYDFHVSFTKDELAKGEAYYNYRREAVSLEDLSGRSVFYKDLNGDIFHTYSSFGRGGEDIHAAYRFSTLHPRGVMRRDRTEICTTGSGTMTVTMTSFRIGPGRHLVARRSVRQAFME